MNDVVHITAVICLLKVLNVVIFTGTLSWCAKYNHTPSCMYIVNSSQCHYVNILFWNIRGITDKLQNRHLCEYICQHDIVCLVESMLDSQKSIQFANYTVYNFARTVRHKRTKHSSSGIAILIANWVNKHIGIKRVNECFCGSYLKTVLI